MPLCQEFWTPLDLTKAGVIPGAPLPPVASASAKSGQSLADLLRKHGAREDVPKLDRIEVRRPSGWYSAEFFTKSTNDWNRFSLLELIAADYHLISTLPAKGETTATHRPSAYYSQFKGEPTQVFVPSDFLLANGDLLPFRSVRLAPVLRESKLLRSSSDLSRVKVTRHDPVTGQKREWVLDCRNWNEGPDLCLRDGDVIEVPEIP